MGICGRMKVLPGPGGGAIALIIVHMVMMVGATAPAAKKPPAAAPKAAAVKPAPMPQFSMAPMGSFMVAVTKRDKTKESCPMEKSAKGGWSVVPSTVVSHKGTKYRLTIRTEGNVFVRLETFVKALDDGKGSGWKPVGDAQGLMVAQKDACFKKCSMIKLAPKEVKVMGKSVTPQSHLTQILGCPRTNACGMRTERKSRSTSSICAFSSK